MTHETKKKKIGDSTVLELYEALEIGVHQAAEAQQRAKRSQVAAIAVGVAVIGFTAGLMLYSAMRVSDAQQALSHQQETAAAAETQIPIQGATQMGHYSKLAQATIDAVMMQQTALPATATQAAFEAELVSTYSLATSDTAAAAIMTAYPNEPSAWMIQGLAHLERGDYDAALMDFNHVIAIDPSHFLAYYNRGMVLYHTQDYQGAIVNFSDAIGRKNTFADAYAMRGASHNQVESYSNAEADYAAAASLGFDTNWFSLQRGILYNNQGQFETALFHLNQALDIDFQPAEAYAQRGFALYSLKQYQGAIEDYSVSLTLDNQHADVYFNRANAYFDLKQFDSAIADYNRALYLDPRHAMAFTNRGNAYDELDMHRDAVKSFSDALAINPKDIDTFYKRANVYFVLGLYEQAIVDYQETLRLNPYYTSSLFSLGHVYYRMESYQKAISYLDQALSQPMSNPTHDYSYNLRAYAYFKMGNVDQALVDVGKAIEIRPNEPNYYDSRCEFYLRSQRWEEGLKDCDKATSLGWTFSSEMQALIRAAQPYIPTPQPGTGRQG